jgi:hypothetical protein
MLSGKFFSGIITGFMFCPLIELFYLFTRLFRERKGNFFAKPVTV